MNETAVIGTEELIQVKLVKLSLRGNLADALWHLIGQHHHLGQLGVWVVVPLPSLLCRLFVRVGPVIDLFLDELTS